MTTLPENPIIIVGGGLAGLSAAHEVYLRGGNVILLDKQGFLSGNSGKATSGINGALTRTQVDLKIQDSVKQFYDDTLKTAKDRANPDLIRVLTYNSADAVHWLEDVFKLDLSVVSRLGGHSQPRTHRGKDAKFPGMAITYALLEKLENLSEQEPHRIAIFKKSQVIDLIKSLEFSVIGVKYKNLNDKSKHELYGPVIMATGGYAADFTKNSLLRKYRPDIIDLPSTNGEHATGDGQKIILKNEGVGIDMDKVQVHPTGLINVDDYDVINQRSTPRFLFLGAEALRGEGGILLNGKGERFCDELGTRDYVSGEMEKNLQYGPIRLVLNTKLEEKLDFHIKHYTLRNLMKTLTGKQLVAEIGCSQDTIEKELNYYNKCAEGEDKDKFGKRFFPSTPFLFKPDDKYHVSFVTRVLHFTMGGIKINSRAEVLHADGDSFTAFEGLYACGEVAGGVHGHNRLGGSSLLACVVYGRVAAESAAAHAFQKLSNESKAVLRLRQVKVHLDPSVNEVVLDFGKSGETTSEAVKPVERSASPAPFKPSSAPSKEFSIPDKEYSLEDVSKHNKPDDCWCIVKNVVLDLTDFLKDHPGGEQSIINFAGKDATESFAMLHDDNVIPRYASGCVLGLLKGTKSELKIK